MTTIIKFCNDTKTLIDGGMKKSLSSCNTSDFNFKIAALSGDQKKGWTLIVDGKTIDTFPSSKAARMKLGTFMSRKALDMAGFMYKDFPRDADGKIIEGVM